MLTLKQIIPKIKSFAKVLQPLNNKAIEQNKKPVELW